jgi:hypothetical protein
MATCSILSGDRAGAASALRLHIKAVQEAHEAYASVWPMRDPRPQSIARTYGDLGESARNHPPLFADALARTGGI